MASAVMKRLSASIPDKLYTQLEKVSDLEGRSISNLVSYLLERSLDERYKLLRQLGKESSNDRNVEAK